MVNEIELTVGELRSIDTSQTKISLSYNLLRELGINPGEIVEIKSKNDKIIGSRVFLDRDEEELGIIYLDSITRQNLDVKVDEKVFLKKAKIKVAKRINIAPMSKSGKSGIDEALKSFIKRRLRGNPINKDVITNIRIIGQPMPFKVVDTEPKGIVVVTDVTKCIIEDAMVDSQVKITYADIGGLDDAIQRIREMIELPLRHPELFEKLAITPPKGVLLYGPPGTGKTMIAKAVAGEADTNFIAIAGPEIMSKFYGESEQRIRNVFKEAHDKAPSIIFIDELDALAPKREEVTGELERRVVAQVLSLMDGLEGRGEIIVIGATNRANALDPALRRPGRFDREIYIKVPDMKGRKEILAIHTRGMPGIEKIKLSELAELTHGFVGADLEALSKEAAMRALREFLPKINLKSDGIQEITLEMLEDLKVERMHFIDALKEVQPSAIREVFVETPNVRWNDIGGLDSVRQELIEAVEWPLKHKEDLKRIGISPIKGVLLYGPTGCGKTLLAKAVARETNSNFISIKGPELISKWVGESEKAVREVFKKARMASPAVIFFDEIDSIATSRDHQADSSSVTKRVISQLLTEMDGIEPLQDIIIIAATNRPDLIDPAILRPGRFDRLIHVHAPNREGRKRILEVHLQKLSLSGDVDVDLLVDLTDHFSGADMEMFCREAGFIALRKNIKAKEISMEDFKDALKKVHASLSTEVLDFYQTIERRFLLDFKKNESSIPPLFG